MMNTIASETPQLTREMLEAYQHRWEAVAEREAQEQCAATFAQRWRKLNALLRMASGLGLLDYEQDKQVEVVRERWNRLRNLHVVDLLERQI